MSELDLAAEEMRVGQPGEHPDKCNIVIVFCVIKCFKLLMSYRCIHGFI